MAPKKIDQVRLQNATRFLEGKRPSLSSTAAVNATRNVLFLKLRDLGLPVECSTGGRTEYNRSWLDIPKTHYLDAACTCKTDSVSGWKQNIQTNTETVQGISWKYCKIISRKYGYNFASQVSSPT